MTPTEQKFYPIELFAPTVLKSNSPNEGPGSGMDIRNSFGDVFTHIHRQTYGHIDPLGKDRKFFNLFLGYISGEIHRNIFDPKRFDKLWLPWILLFRAATGSFHFQATLTIYII